MKWMHRLTSAAALLAAVLMTGCGGGGPAAPNDPFKFKITEWSMVICQQPGDGYHATVTVAWEKARFNETGNILIFGAIGPPLDSFFTCQLTEGRDGSCTGIINLGPTLSTGYYPQLGTAGAVSGEFKNIPPGPYPTCSP